MRIEHIVQKDGYKVKVIVEVLQFYSQVGISFVIRDVQYLPQKKRKWLSVGQEVKDSYGYCRVKGDEEKKTALFMEKFLEYCTEEDMHTAIQVAYEAIKPDGTLTVHYL